MRRYWVPKTFEKNQEVYIGGDEFHHICDVCRQSEGSKFEVLTEDGWALFVELYKLGKKEAWAKVIEKRKIAELARPHIHLALSVPKLATFEKVLEKSVELGVHSIWPFYSDYSFVKTKKKVFTDKAARMERIVKGATQQTGRGQLMTIRPPLNLESLIEEYKKSPTHHGIFAYEGEGGESLKNGLSKLPEDCQQVWLFIGSEGGFSRREVELFQGINLFPVSLGHQVLRVETACVTLLSVIKYELGLF